MFNNALNRDTVYYMGMNDSGWQSTDSICASVNRAGYAISLVETETLLLTLAEKGKVEHDFITLDDGKQCVIWKKK